MTGCDDVRLQLVLGRSLDAAAAAHLRGCDGCRATEPAARALAAALAADVPPLPSRTLSARVRRAAAAPLAVHARRAARPDWRALARAVGVAVLPLPVLLYLDAMLVRGAYHVLSVLLPAALSLYLVASYAIVLALMMALTYGAVPLLAARQGWRARGGFDALEERHA